MSCFWRDKVGVGEDCGAGGEGEAFAKPYIIDNSSPAENFILRIFPACGPCFGSPEDGSCLPVTITTATIVSGTAYRDSSSTGCSLRYACHSEDTGEACEIPEFPACGACDSPTLCGIEFDTGAAAESWAIGEIELEVVTDPLSGETGFAVPLTALNSGGGQPLHYAELIVDTDVGAGFVWHIGQQNCD